MSTMAAGDIAVVIAAHGDRAGARPNETLLAHRDALRAAADFRHIAAGVLKGEPTLEDALSAAQDSGATHMVVYPYFMADGHFTRTVLPRRIAELGLADRCRLLVPLGLDPALPDLVLAQARAAAERARIAAPSARLLVVGHGSKLGPASAEATERVAHQLRAAGGFARIETAFLEETPFLNERLREDNSLPTIVSGFFSGDGLHAGEDVPEAIREAGANAHYAGPVGLSPDIARLIRDSVLSAILV